MACGVFVYKGSEVNAMVPSAVLANPSRFRSKTVRRAVERVVLREKLHVQVVQLQGHLFFGNAGNLLDKLEATVEHLLLRAFHQNTAAESWGSSDVHSRTSSVLCAPFMLLDFRAVVSIDCTAIEQLLKLRARCRGTAIRANKRGIDAARSIDGVGVQLVLVGVQEQLLEQLFKARVVSFEAENHNDGSASLDKNTNLIVGGDGRERIIGLSGGGAVLAPSLEFAIQWCETQLLAGMAAVVPDLLAISKEDHELQRCGSVVAAFHKLCSPEDEAGDDFDEDQHQKDIETLGRLQMYFEQRTLEPGTILWRKGDSQAKCAILLDSGLLSVDRGASVHPKPRGELSEVVGPGQVYGLLTFLTRASRVSTLRAIKHSTIHVLSAKSLREISARDPELYQTLLRATLNYSARYCFNLSL
jgi:CRP-like cAMP-binding protein/anti-anti-sigma regulatory factor